MPCQDIGNHMFLNFLPSEEGDLLWTNTLIALCVVSCLPYALGYRVLFCFLLSLFLFWSIIHTPETIIYLSKQSFNQKPFKKQSFKKHLLESCQLIKNHLKSSHIRINHLRSCINKLQYKLLPQWPVSLLHEMRL